MICPVCEHQQALGAECEQCGKVFDRPKAPSAPVARLAEFEPTVPEGLASDVPVQPLTDLELNRIAKSGPDMPATPMAELERTAMSSVSNVSVQPLQDLESGRTVDDAPPTAVDPNQTTCRYCRTPQPQGAFCERCGMSLPKMAKPSPVARKPSDTEPIRTRCRACGAPAKAGARCGDCGQPVPIPDRS